MELYGIACIDDREAYEENVWGLHGMVEFLQKWLVKSGVFDAIILAYNV